MVLGNWSRKDTLYGGDAGYSVPSSGDLAAQLAEAIGKLPRFEPMEATQPEEKAVPAFVPPPPERHIGEGSFFVGDDRTIYQVEGGQTATGHLLRRAAQDRRHAQRPQDRRV